MCSLSLILSIVFPQYLPSYPSLLLFLSFLAMCSLCGDLCWRLSPALGNYPPLCLHYNQSACSFSIRQQGTEICALKPNTMTLHLLMSLSEKYWIHLMTKKHSAMCNNCSNVHYLQLTNWVKHIEWVWFRSQLLVKQAGYVWKVVFGAITLENVWAAVCVWGGAQIQLIGVLFQHFYCDGCSTESSWFKCL